MHFNLSCILSTIPARRVPLHIVSPRDLGWTWARNRAARECGGAEEYQLILLSKSQLLTQIVHYLTTSLDVHRRATIVPGRSVGLPVSCLALGLRGALSTATIAVLP